jgi:hypothetical protein
VGGVTTIRKQLLMHRESKNGGMATGNDRQMTGACDEVAGYLDESYIFKILQMYLAHAYLPPQNQEIELVCIPW